MRIDVGVILKQEGGEKEEACVISPSEVNKRPSRHTPKTSLSSHVRPGGVFEPNSFDGKSAYLHVFVAEADGMAVASSTLDRPCQPSSGRDGFYSGIMKAGDSFTVERRGAAADGPLFFYSPSGMDCASGNSGVMNPSGSQTLDAYVAAAAAANRPGVAPEKAFGGTLLPASKTPLSTPLSAAAAANDAPRTMPPGVVVIAVFGALVVLGIVLGISWFGWAEWVRHRRHYLRGVSIMPCMLDDTFNRAFGDGDDDGDSDRKTSVVVVVAPSPSRKQPQQDQQQQQHADPLRVERRAESGQAPSATTTLCIPD